MLSLILPLTLQLHLQDMKRRIYMKEVMEKAAKHLKKNFIRTFYKKMYGLIGDIYVYKKPIGYVSVTSITNSKKIIHSKNCNCCIDYAFNFTDLTGLVSLETISSSELEDLVYVFKNKYL